MPALILLVGEIIAKVFSDNVLRWIAFKAIMLFLFVIILPLVFNNFLCDLLQMMFGIVSDNSGGLNSFNPTFSMSDLAGWFANCFRLTECMAVIVSAMVCKVTLKQIPLLRF